MDGGAVVIVVLGPAGRHADLLLRRRLRVLLRDLKRRALGSNVSIFFLWKFFRDGALLQYRKLSRGSENGRVGPDEARSGAGVPG